MQLISLQRMQRLVYHEVSADSADALVSDWSLRNACVTFRTWRGTLHRAHFVSREGLAAVIHSFSEYSFGFGRLSFVRPAQPEDRAALDGCERQPLGLAFTMSSNNLYHQFFHAVPAYVTLHRYVQPGATFVPLVSYMAKSWLHPSTNYSHAWEFSIRALSSLSSQQIKADTLRLLHGRCTCFDRVEGATGAVSLFNPRALPQILAFCRAALHHARMLPSVELPAAERVWSQRRSGRNGVTVLYVRRGGSKRILANDEQVSRALCAAPRAARHGELPRHVAGSTWRAACVVLEKLTLTMQMRSIAAASVMVGVHGQAMVWMPFMLSDRPRAAVVEVTLPKVHRASVSDPGMYRHARIFGPLNVTPT